MAELKQEALATLREWREEDGSCYQSLSRLVKVLECKPEELYDWNTDSGVLLELCNEGKVHSIGHDSFLADGHMVFDR